jgi:hypothetical protein
MFTPPKFAPPVWFGVLCCLGATLSLPGCGPGGARLVPVVGKVMVGDKLLTMDANTTGTVILYPDKAKGNDSLEEPRGTLDSSGTFKIFTGTKPGAAPGWYKVTVDAARVIDPKNPYHSASSWLHPERYIDKEKSKLAFEVVENAAPGAFDLKLDPK